MELRELYSLNTFERVVDFLRRHPLSREIVRVTVLAGRLNGVVVRMRGMQATQDDGRSTVSAGVEKRDALKAEVLGLMRPIGEIARSVDREEFPGLAERFKMPRGNGNARLISRARAFVAALEAEAVKVVFIDRGLEEAFVEELAGKTDELEAAGKLKYEGLARQIGGTAGLKAAMKEGMKLVRELDGILRQQYRGDAEMLAAWTAARRRRAAGVGSTEGGAVGGHTELTGLTEEGQRLVQAAGLGMAAELTLRGERWEGNRGGRGEGTD